MAQSKKTKIPKIKKQIKAFLSSEEGSINKSSVAKMGVVAIASAAALSGLMKPNANIASATCAHSSHSSHGSHGSHAAHGSHGSHGAY